VVSFGGKSWELDAPISVFEEGGEWRPAAEIPRDDIGTVEAGARHFIACLRGREQPILTAEHARHVLDIMLKAYESIVDGKGHATETTFEPR